MREEAVRFINALALPDEILTFQTFDDSSEKQKSLVKIIHARQGDELPFAELTKLEEKGAGVFITVNATDGKGRKAGNVTRVRAVFVDLDGAPIEPVLQGPLRPSCVVESSPQHWHAYWFLADLPLEEFAGIQKVLASNFGGDSKVSDLPRVMRLPGFKHQKNGGEFVTRIVELHPERIYSRAEILAALEIKIEKPNTKKSNSESPPLPGTQSPVTPRAKAALSSEIKFVTHAPPGTRNDSLNRAAFNLSQLVASEEIEEKDVRDALMDAAHGVGLSPGEALATIDSGFRAGLERPREKTDLKKTTPLFEGLPSEWKAAEIWASIARDKIKYIIEEKKFYVYDSGIWHEDGNAALAWHLVKDTAKLIRDSASSVPGIPPKPFLKLADSLETSKSIESLLKIGAKLIGISAKFAEFDRDDFLLNLANGTLNLKTLELKPHSPKDMLCLQSPVSYDPNATAPRWNSFLLETLPDAETRQYLQRYVGACLTGSVNDQVALFCYGPSAENGKSTLLGAILKLLGTYATTFAVDALLAKTNPGQASSKLANLAGKRFCWASESSSGHALNEAMFKNMVSGEPLQVRRLYGFPFTLQPRFKIVLDTNFLPVARDGGHGVFRRQAIIRFDKQVSPERRDTGIHAKLEAELPGILNWAIEGFKAWRFEGGSLRNLPHAIREEVEIVKDDSDEIMAFIRARCNVTPSATFSLSEFAEAYNTHARATAGKPRPMQVLAPYLRQLGCTRREDRFGRALWKGLSILPPGYITIPTGKSQNAEGVN